MKNDDRRTMLPARKSRAKARIRAVRRLTRFYKIRSTLALEFFGATVDFSPRLTKKLRCNSVWQSGRGNDEARMTNDERMTKPEARTTPFVIRHSTFFRH
jgi:hypothetical protein